MSYCNRFKAISRQFRNSTRFRTPRVLTSGMRQFTPLLTQTQAPLPTFLSSASKQSFACSFSTASFSTVTPNSGSSNISQEESDESEEGSEKSKGMSNHDDSEDKPRTDEKVYDPGIDDKDQPYEFTEEKQEPTASPEPEKQEPNQAEEQTAKAKEGMGWWSAFKEIVRQLGESGPEPNEKGYSGHNSRLEEENHKLRQVGVNLQEDLVRLRTRTDKEKKEIEKFACEKFAKELLVVQDNFALAMKNLTPQIKATVNNKEVLSVLEGVELTQKTLLKAFEKCDVRKIETVGQADFSCHEVMFTLKMEGKPDNEIVEVLRDGYWIGDRVLRAAQVGVVKNA